MSITTILWGLFIVILFTSLLIFLTRLFFNMQASKDLTSLHKNDHWKSPLEGRNKYPEVNTFLLSGTFLNYGLIVALVLMIFAFSWTTYEQKVDLSQYMGTLSDEIEIETPRTAEPPPPPPPPPPPTPQAMEIVANDLPDVESVVFQDQSISEETAIEAPVIQETHAAPPPPPPPRFQEAEQEIFKIVEENPTFPGCEEVPGKAERKKCAEEKLLEFIYRNIQYPAVARDNGVEGMVVLQFVVEKDGSITNIKIVRDIGAGCGEEAKRVVAKMPKWNPGKQRERPVRVQFTLPVKFVLQS